MTVMPMRTRRHLSVANMVWKLDRARLGRVVGASGLFSIQLLIVIGLFLMFRLDEPGGWLVAVLFLIPPAIQSLGILLLRDPALRIFYCSAALVSSGPYFGCWLLYIVVPSPSMWLAWFALAVAAALMMASYVLASAMFADSVWPRRWRSNVRLGVHPSAEVLFFLAFFIAVLYIVSFSTAFAERATLLQTASSTDTPIAHERIQFRAASTRVDTTEAESVLQALQREITRAAAKEPIRVTIIGSTDSVPVALSFGMSNYDIAAARALAVQARLQQALPAHLLVDWSVVPRVHSAGGWRGAEIVVQPLAPIGSRASDRLLTLLEYVYYTIYAVTTRTVSHTGPSSPFSMFASIVVGLFALFFVVIFFNVLLMTKRDTRA